MFVSGELLGLDTLCACVYLCKSHSRLTQKFLLAIVDADIQWLPFLWLTHLPTVEERVSGSCRAVA